MVSLQNNSLLCSPAEIEERNVGNLFTSSSPSCEPLFHSSLVTVFSAFIIFSLIQSLKVDKTLLYQRGGLFLLYMVVVMNALTNLMTIILWSVGILKNIFILIRPLLLLTYLGVICSIVCKLCLSLRCDCFLNETNFSLNVVLLRLAFLPIHVHSLSKYSGMSPV